MPRKFLRDAQPGDLLDDVLLFTNKQIATTNGGKFYIKAFVGDKTTQLTARMWNASQQLFQDLPDGGFVHVRGHVENYQSNLQVILDHLSPPREGTYDIADLMPCTKKDVATLFARVTELLESIQNTDLHALIRAFLADEKLMADFRRAPAAQSFHHAYLGGLLEHTTNAMEVVNAVAPFYPTLNRDLVLAGVFLHDLAKTWELKYETAFGYTDGGQLIGHIVKATLWVEDKAAAAAKTLGRPVARELVDVVQHIILSHHGEPEYGAAKVPATPEAIAVHEIENMDAKLTMALAATRDPDQPNAGGPWTDYLKAFGVKMYRPDVAPADRVVGQAGPSTAKSLLTNPLFGDFIERSR